MPTAVKTLPDHAPVRVIKKYHLAACDLFVCGAVTPEFVVQVVDRQSTILRRHVAETLVWHYVNPGTYHGSNADAAFRAVANTPPILRLNVASVDDALRLVAA
ncbi:hypothetical protein BH09ACT9_BH09ACT9_00060 [soil metagenome]